MIKQQKISLGQTGQATKKINCSPTAKNLEQKEVLRSFASNQVTVIYGPPGTGKTLMATLWGLNEFLAGRYDKLIFTRPAVEAYGERLGYLPGDADEKIAPYMLPIVSFILDKIDSKFLDNLIKEKRIMTIPLAYMRGMTFSNSFVLLDEAQNCVPQQLRLFLTRLGENSKAVVTGDVNQSDLGINNGLTDIINRLGDIEGLGIHKLTTESVFRSEIVKKIENRYLET